MPGNVPSLQREIPSPAHSLSNCLRCRRCLSLIACLSRPPMPESPGKNVIAFGPSASAYYISPLRGPEYSLEAFWAEQGMALPILSNCFSAQWGWASPFSDSSAWPCPTSNRAGFAPSPSLFSVGTTIGPFNNSQSKSPIPAMPSGNSLLLSAR